MPFYLPCISAGYRPNGGADCGGCSQPAWPVASISPRDGKGLELPDAARSSMATRCTRTDSSPLMIEMASSGCADTAAGHPSPWPGSLSTPGVPR